MNSIKNFFEFVHIIISTEIIITIRFIEYLIITDSLFIRLISSIFVIEFRYDIFFRQILDKISNLVIFNTGFSNIWIYNLVFIFIISESYSIEIIIFIFPKFIIIESTVILFANYTEDLE